MQNPSVTVLMPVFNGERYLQPAIESILTQTYPEFELLIIDDGSTDRSSDIIQSYRDDRIRIVSNGKNLGLSETLNRGLQLAKGELIARQDADDVSHPRRLEHQIRRFMERPRLALLGAQAWVIDGNGRFGGLLLDRPCEDRSIHWELLFDNSFLHSTIMFRKHVVLDELQGYDGRYLCAEDYELWSRVARSHLVENLPLRLISYRRHGGSRTMQYRRMAAEENRRIVKRNIAEYFGSSVVTDEQVDCVVRYRVALPFDEVTLERLLGVIQRLRVMYEQRHPEVNQSRDYKLAVARQYLKILWNLNPKTGSLVMQTLKSGMGYDLACAAFLLGRAVVEGKVHEMSRRTAGKPFYVASAGLGQV